MMESEGLNREQQKKVQTCIDSLDTLSAEVGAEGSLEIIEELYLLVTKILERYPELELEEDENSIE